MAKESPSMALAKKGTKAAEKNLKQTKQGELVQHDLISDTAYELETLDKSTAYKLVEQLGEDIEYTYFRLGGVLSVIQSNGWYTDEGFDSFRTFCESKFGLKYRKAMYLIAIYNSLVEAKIPWNKVKELGWTKLKELAPILTQDNVDEWAAKASEMTTLQLQDAIKQSQTVALNGPDEESEPATSTTTTLSFKLHEDQKQMVKEALDKAKKETGTDVDAVALENIIMGYLGGNAANKSKPQPTDLKTVMNTVGWEKTLEMFEQLWPDIELTVAV